MEIRAWWKEQPEEPGKAESLMVRSWLRLASVNKDGFARLLESVLLFKHFC